MANTISFWKLLCNETDLDTIDRFVVPVIQRDYAQGRTDDKATTIRKKILKCIGNALEQDESEAALSLDFIYGAKSGMQVELIDGQQRFTTLFLLHWYIAGMAGKDDAFEVLRKFTYRSRPSSLEFCENLCENHKLIFNNVKERTNEFLNDKNHWYKKNANKGLFTVIIQDLSWFLKEWEQDPTVCSMLNMVDAIFETFYKSEDSPWYEEVWNKLTGDNAPVVFHFLPIDQFGNSEDLYIKMNSRGKALTNFENFKALFGKHLEEMGVPSLYQEYWKNIDGDWSVVFWEFVKKRYDDNKIPQQEFYFNIDETILKYIWIQVEMYSVAINASRKEQPDFYVGNRVQLRFEHIDNPNNTEEDWTGKTFNDKTPEELIISSLQKSKDILELIEEMFDGSDAINCWSKNGSVINQLFVLERWDANTDKSVAMYGIGDYFIRILAFVVIYWCSAFDVPKTEAEKKRLKGYLRAIRNSLRRYRTKKSGRRCWDSELDKKNYGRAVSFILTSVLNNQKDYVEQLSNIPEQSSNISYFTQELKKCQIIKNYSEDNIKECEMLEDSELLQGSVLPLLDNDKPIITEDELKSIFEASDKVVLGKALLACGKDECYFAIPSGESGNNRTRIAFCDNEIQAWSVALLYTRDDFSTNNIMVLKELLVEYRKGKSLKDIFHDYCSKCETSNSFTWQYYFIKYGDKLFNGETNLKLAGRLIPKYPTLGLYYNNDFFACRTSLVMSRFSEDNTCNVFLLMAVSQINAEITLGNIVVISKDNVQVETTYDLNKNAFIIRSRGSTYSITPSNGEDVISTIKTQIESLLL